MIRLSLLAAHIPTQVEYRRIIPALVSTLLLFFKNRTGADGKRYRVKYTADEFGYHPITELDDFELPE